jgi:prepilin-type processing-associated H-X9-DG protein
MNSTVTQTVINGFLCPSDRQPSWTVHGADAVLLGLKAAGNNYFASTGSGLEFAQQQSSGPPNGPFGYVGTLGHVIKIAEVTDGLSNTIGFGEWKIGDGTSHASVQDIVFTGSFPAGTKRNDGSLTAPNPKLSASLGDWLNNCAAKWRAGQGRFGKTDTIGEAWALGLVGYSLGNLTVGPNSKYPNCSTDGGGTIMSVGSYALSSFHPGGTNVLFLDGSVRFLKDSVNQTTLWSLGSIKQGEVISSDAY